MSSCFNDQVRTFIDAQFAIVFLLRSYGIHLRFIREMTFKLYYLRFVNIKHAFCNVELSEPVHGHTYNRREISIKLQYDNDSTKKPIQEYKYITSTHNKQIRIKPHKLQKKNMPTLIFLYKYPNHTHSHTFIAPAPINLH